MNNLVIPKEKRFDGLRQSLFAFAESLQRALKTNPNLLAVPLRDAFWALSLPWLIELEVPDANLEVLKLVESRKHEILLAGFDGDKIAQDLLNIRISDVHLRECCPALMLLARHFSRHFLCDAVALLDAGSDLVRLEQLYETFEKMTYEQGPFCRSSFTHVFNLEIEGEGAKIGDVTILRLNPDFKGIVLGEQTPEPFLHPPGLGDCFIYSSEGASSETDANWLQTKRSLAFQFVMLLQYLKPGLVHVGYTSPAFYPQWTHQIRRDGLFFMGDPRRTPHQRGQAFYKIAQEEHGLIAKYWNAMQTPKIATAINDRSSKLRQAILRAGEYYEKSHATEDSPGRLIDLAVALEALYSPDNQEQLRFRISQAAAQFLGGNSENKRAIFDSIQELYARRNKIVHGGYDVAKYMSGTLVTPEELDLWSDLVRRSVLGFFVLALRGATDRIKLLKQLENAAFDENEAKLLQQQASLDGYLGELNLS